MAWLEDLTKMSLGGLADPTKVETKVTKENSAV
jgi:hypothetical protein